MTTACGGQVSNSYIRGQVAGDYARLGVANLVDVVARNSVLHDSC